MRIVVRALPALAILVATAACDSTSQSNATTNASTNPRADGAAGGSLHVVIEDGGVLTTTVDAGLLTCNWVWAANCWKAILAPAIGCLPPYDWNNPVAGTLNADLTQCTYPNGQTVTLTGGFAPSFSVTSDAGGPCLSMDQYYNGFTVTTAAGTAAVWVNDPTETVFQQVLSVACDDGTVLTGGYIPYLENCGNSVTPGKYTSTGSASNPDGGGMPIESLSIGFIDDEYDDAGDTELVAFSCTQPY